ncbi:MAG: hypothetical protein E4G90_07390, partial [Gemmatimonadales bacterium]
MGQVLLHDLLQVHQARNQVVEGVDTVGHQLEGFLGADAMEMPDVVRVFGPPPERPSQLSGAHEVE